MRNWFVFTTLSFWGALVSSGINAAPDGADAQILANQSKNRATARRASDGVPVKLEDLRSNTPFVSYMRTTDANVSMRFAIGFRVVPETVQFSLNGAPLTGIRYEIEPRGDSLLIRDPASITRLSAQATD